MGNHRFKISNMMPNSWYHKLKNMNKQISTNKTHPLINQLPEPFIQNRVSSYIPSNSPLHPKALDTHFPLDSPRKADRKYRKMPVVSSPILAPSQPDQLNDVNDVVFELPPIITKPPKNDERVLKHSKRIRVRANSPRLKALQRSIKQRKCNSLSESFIVIKKSCDAKKDFRESMMEMVVENDLKGAKDLEELLAFYLCLNSSEYHHVIVKAFEEIWFDVKEIIRA